MCSPRAAEPYSTTDCRAAPYAARNCATSSSSVIRAMGHQDPLEPPPLKPPPPPKPPNPPPPPPPPNPPPPPKPPPPHPPPPIGRKMGRQPRRRRPRPPPSMERMTNS